MSGLTVGVVLPLYNKATTINRALASVFAQEAPLSAVVVIDDGSTDGSADAIAPEWRDRIDLRRVPNGGPGKARNLGAAACGGDLIAFLDADDAWKPGYLAAAIAALSSEPESAAYVAAYDLGERAHLQREELRALFPHTGPWRIDAFDDPRALKSYIDAIHSSSTVVRRSAFDALGGFFADERCTYGEDSWLWLRLAFGHAIHFDRERRTHFHIEDSALGHAQYGRHPRLPALRFPDRLRAACPSEARARLDRLLAYYRLIETEKLAAAGDCTEVAALRRSFPFRRAVPLRLMAREIRVHLRCLRARASSSNGVVAKA